MLIVTPSTENTRHLEVLASFARAIGRNRDVRSLLYKAKTPAHAYEVLHGDKRSESFNQYVDRGLRHPAK